MKKVFVYLFFLIISVLRIYTVCGAEVSLREEYMEDTGGYRYYLDDDNYIESSLRLESVINNVVRIRYNDYVTVMLYKDGAPQQFLSGDYIFGDGEYTVIIKKDDKVGRIRFIMDTVTSENINIEDKFYNNVEFIQTYDSKKGWYIQSIEDGYSIYTNIPNYAVTDKSVKIYADESRNAYITVTRNGTEIDFASGKTFSEEGWYCVNIVYSDNSNSYYYNEDYTIDDFDESELSLYTDEQIEKELENAQEEPIEENIINAVADVAEYKFQIIKSAQNRLSYINPPQDYEIYSIALNGKNISLESRKNFKISQDGDYTVVFKSIKNLPDYRISYVFDTKAPVLEFDGIDSDGNAKGRVEITGGYEDAQVVVRSNGMPVNIVGNVIDSDGLYVIEAVDSAGNKNVYMINVRVPFEIGIIGWGLIIFVAAAVIGTYVFYVKSNVKIR